MKDIKVIVEVEVPDGFRNWEALNNFISGTLDNAPEPEEIDEALKDVSLGINYIG